MVESFEFYPHTCTISRGTSVDPLTGKQVKDVVYEGACYLSQGHTGFRENQYSTEDTVMLPDSSVLIEEGDEVVVTLENGSIFRASVKQAYPISDPDIGGQDLKLHK